MVDTIGSPKGHKPTIEIESNDTRLKPISAKKRIQTRLRVRSGGSSVKGGKRIGIWIGGEDSNLFYTRFARRLSCFLHSEGLALQLL